MVRVIEGNLFDLLTPRCVVMHQANCLGAAGAGVAQEIKDRVPGWFDSYAEHCKRHGGPSLLGTFHTYDAADGLKVCSVFGQLGVGRERRQTDYGAWKKALPEIVMQLEARRAAGDEWSVRAPYGLGCGLGGGDWGVMKDLFDYYAGYSPVDFAFCRLPGAR